MNLRPLFHHLHARKTYFTKFLCVLEGKLVEGWYTPHGLARARGINKNELLRTNSRAKDQAFSRLTFASGKCPLLPSVFLHGNIDVLPPEFVPRFDTASRAHSRARSQMVVITRGRADKAAVSQSLLSPHTTHPTAHDEHVVVW